MATSLDSRALYYNYLSLLCLLPAQHALLDLGTGDAAGRNHSVSRTGQPSPGVSRRDDPNPRGLDTKSPSLKHPVTSEQSRSTDGDDEARRDGRDNSFHLLRACSCQVPEIAESP